MPVNTSIATDVWLRYAWLRDNGHLAYVKKATQCDDFFVGMQWDPHDLALLKSQRRPALTINKIISTVSNVLGEQIYQRTDTAFRPRNEGATEDIASALTKVYMQISDNNQLSWLRSDVFCDGIITSRGFFDARLDFTDSLRGEVRITQLNPKNVLVDADADEYDPDKWGDVIVTKWMSPDQIELLYSKADADLLRSRTDSYFPYGYDSIDRDRDRFGFPRAMQVLGSENERNISRNIRVIERQWRKLDRVLHFVDVRTGDMREVPKDWDDVRIAQYLQANPDITTTKKLIHRIRWTVIADNVVLHDDWSPYKHFTVVPYFPYFRRGRTIGLVENLLGPQELLNKVSSQELHVVNTTANSGWMIKRNALTNMSIAELEQRGAQSGLVLELDELTNAEKISPNQTPSGLDRISFKAEDHIKSISGVSDYMQGFAREDVAAKSVSANKQSGQANLAKVMDNMNRTDYMLARNILDMVQDFYTEPRLMHITTDRLMNTTQQLQLNQPTPEGQILNDLTLGEYAVVITTQPERDTFEDSQFDQAVSLRKDIGVQLPDSVIIQASKLKDKAKILQQMQEAANSPEQQQAVQLNLRKQQAEVGKLEAEAQQKGTDAQLKHAKAQKEMVLAHRETQTVMNGGVDPSQPPAPMPEDPMAKLQAEMDFKHAQLEQEMALKREQMEREFALKKELADREFALKKQDAESQRMAQRVQQVHSSALQRKKTKPQPESAHG